MTQETESPFRVGDRVSVHGIEGVITSIRANGDVYYVPLARGSGGERMLHNVLPALDGQPVTSVMGEVTAAPMRAVIALIEVGGKWKR